MNKVEYKPQPTRQLVSTLVEGTLVYYSGKVYIVPYLANQKHRPVLVSLQDGATWSDVDLEVDVIAPGTTITITVGGAK